MLRVVDAMIKISQHRCAAHVEWVAWAPKFAQAEAARSNQHCQHDAISREVRPVIAPRHDDFVCFADDPAEPPIVARTHGVTGATQHMRRRRSKRKEIRHRELPKSPGACELNAATNRSIVDAVICRRRVQSDEQHRWLRRVPHSAQRVTIASIA
jgi:hypothetical protein